MNAIFTRRSIRKYTGQPVSDELIQTLLRAAMAAPSAGNQQPWHFVVVADHDIMDKVTEFHPHAGMLTEAPLAILACGDPTVEKFEGRWPLDCSAATENLLLAAHAKGLGAVWLAIYPVPERIAGMRDLLGIPEQVVPFCLVSIGYPAEEKKPEDRFNPERVHNNKW
ncbi:nitroreductase family protein [candidate division WOR-3 bacterium]|uniref:Nitroreductase family protein n=1 Tax=candidate division WOR-3 bacterium TaxID=2052148 RepID=A0A9D5K9V7_UNCW3|nr:nitroreductase family protein [candidate division WOR-3 bacterium]MBD3365148.1 nitroreductase family protein [candidate division WOR-3 bacterium]